jgi:hypothetical protein
MSLARNIELYHDWTEVDMALSGKAGTAKVGQRLGESGVRILYDLQVIDRE